MYRRLLELVLCLVLFNACNQPRYIYSQNVRNLHFFQDKGESKVSASLATGPSRSVGDGTQTYNRGVDLQGAYAVGRQVAITAAYHSRKEKDRIVASNFDIIRSDVSYRRNGFEVGGSYFFAVDRQYASFFHVDGGFGFGNDRFTDTGTFDSLGTTRFFRNKNTRLYLQPGLYTGNGELRFAMGVKLQWTMINGIETDYLPAEQQLFQLAGLNNFFTVEPYACLRFSPSGLPWLSMEAQGSFATVNKDYYIRGGYLSFGLVFTPNLRR